VWERLQQDSDEYRAKRILRMLDELKQGSVIVEGQHDVRTLGHFGITAIPYPKLAKSVLEREKKIYFFMDNDKGGEEKAEKAKSVLMDTYKGFRVNEVLGRKMLNMLNATSVEQIRAPIEEALEREKGKKKRVD
jgi:5S rRNA maturation endonuclease (ribonuclease M5)